MTKQKTYSLIFVTILIIGLLLFKLFNNDTNAFLNYGSSILIATLLLAFANELLIFWLLSSLHLFQKLTMLKGKSKAENNTLQVKKL